MIHRGASVHTVNMPSSRAGDARASTSFIAVDMSMIKARYSMVIMNMGIPIRNTGSRDSTQEMNMPINEARTGSIRMNMIIGRH